ncbi:hypothetical protein C6P43_000751 [Kluyveromyces marxianus]|nr:hypothetical protein C6P43_000751 [Kluyveromyces marxianus]
MYQRDAIHNGQSGKFSSLKYLRKPQRITNQIESNTMNNVLRRNTDLNKSNVLMDRALDSLAGKPHLEVSEDDLSKDLSERLNFDEGGDPLDVGSASTGNEPSLSMNEYFPIAETSQSPAVEEEKEEEECISPSRRLPKLDTENDDDDDEPEDRYLHSRRLSSIFKPPSILLTRSKSLPTSPFEKKPDPERPLLFKRSKSVHFAQSERFEVKYFREDESPLFLRNESGEYGTKSGKLRKSRRHRRREAQEDTDRLEMGSGPRNLELINGNLTLRGQTPTSLKLDVFGMMSNHFKNFNNNNGGYHFHSPFKLNQSDSNFNLRAPFKPNFGFKLDSFGDSETELPLRNHGKIGDGNGEEEYDMNSLSIAPNDTNFGDNVDDTNNSTFNRNDDATDMGFHYVDYDRESNGQPPEFMRNPNISSFVCHLHDLRLDVRGNMLIGNVFVRNISYEKKVTVRYTFDKWVTQNDVESIWVSHDQDLKIAGGSLDIDIFQFAIDLGESNDTIAIELCILYQTREGPTWVDHWDNNSGKNYKIAIREAQQSS